MAQVDTSIAQSFKPIQLESPVNQMANLYQLQGAQQANQLRAIQMQAAQRELDQQNALANAYRNSLTEEGELDYNLLKQNLAKGGQGAQIPGIVKSQREAQKLQFEGEEAKGKLIDLRLKQSRDALDRLDPNAPDAAQRYLAWHNANHADPVLGAYLKSQGVTAEQAFKDINQAINTGRLAELIDRSKLGVTKVQEMRAPKPQAVDLRDRSVLIDMNPQSATFKQELSSQKKGKTEHEAVMESQGQQRLGLEGKRISLTEQRQGEPSDLLSPKERQKREAAFPQATAAIKGFEAKSQSFVNDLKALRDHPGLPEITGMIAGRAPGVTKNGRAAQALYDKILAKGGFEALQQMREASKTGGALGNVSNQEGKQLQASFAAIDRRQDAADVKAALDTAIGDVEGARTRMREAYDTTYDYKSAREPAAAKPPAAGMSEQDKAALNWANSNPKDPRAAKIKQRLGVQ